MTTRYMLELDDTTHAALKAYAKREGRTMKYLITTAVNTLLDAEQNTPAEDSTVAEQLKAKMKRIK